MERTSPSRTAEDMAGFRAMEMLRPKADRVCEDPFAEHFLTGPWVERVKKPFQAKIFQWITHLINPGAQNTVPVRVKFIDEHIKTCLENGLEQLVILGAGYDARACRLEELKNGVRVFEVDAPQTQTYKKEVLHALFGKLPENIIFVPCELGRDGIEKQLLDNGFDTDKVTLFILEGLVMYLDPGDVKALFSIISRMSCPGSSVVFDFLPPGIEDGSIENRGGRNMHKWAQKKGEPFKFGIDQAQLPVFLSPIGFDNIQVTPAQACRAMYFTGKNAKRPVSPLFFFANASVARK